MDLCTANTRWVVSASTKQIEIVYMPSIPWVTGLGIFVRGGFCSRIARKKILAEGADKQGRWLAPRGLNHSRRSFLSPRAATLNDGTISARNYANGLRVGTRLPLATDRIYPRNQ